MRIPALPYLETAAAGAWWTVGAAALPGGLGTVVLAAGLGVTGAMAVTQRRRYGSGQPLPPDRRRRLLRLLIGAVVAITAAGFALGAVGYAELLVPLVGVLVGVTLLLLSSVLDARSLVAAGSVLLLLGATGAVLALDSAGQLYPQGLVGLGAGATLWLFGAQRTGLLADLRYRVGR